MLRRADGYIAVISKNVVVMCAVQIAASMTCRNSGLSSFSLSSET